MRVAIVNPNSSREVTDLIRRRLEDLAPPAEWECLTNEGAPEVIESAADAERSRVSLLATLAGRTFDAVVLAGFVDPGIEELRERLGLPVVGMGATALFGASCLGPFGILTVRKDLEPLVWDFVDALGYRDRCLAVRSVDLGVLGVMRDDLPVEPMAHAFRDLAGAGARAICLGSASLSPRVSRWQTHAPVPLVDGIGLAVHFALGLGATMPRGEARP